MLDFEADSKVEVSDDALLRVSQLISNLHELKKQHTEMSETLQELEKQIEKLEQHTLPDLFDELGVKEFTTQDGVKVRVKELIRASIPEARRTSAYHWLEDNGHGSIIKTSVSCEFGKGDLDKAKQAFETLHDMGFSDASLKKSIHFQTLQAFVKEEIAKGSFPPEDLFSVFIGRKVEVVKGK